MFGRFILLACLALTACADVWVRPGSTPDQLAHSKFYCDDAAVRVLPPRPVTVLVSAAHTTPVERRCRRDNDRTVCRTTGGDFVPDRYDTQDANEDARLEYVRSCMTSLGWTRK